MAHTTHGSIPVVLLVAVLNWYSGLALLSDLPFKRKDKDILKDNEIVVGPQPMKRSEQASEGASFENPVV